MKYISLYIKQLQLSGVYMNRNEQSVSARSFKTLELLGVSWVTLNYSSGILLVFILYTKITTRWSAELQIYFRNNKINLKLEIFQNMVIV